MMPALLRWELTVRLGNFAYRCIHFTFNQYQTSRWAVFKRFLELVLCRTF